MTKPVCYLDLDGVLVDFVAGAHAVHGWPLDRSAVPWDFNEQHGISANQFWAPCGFDFWAGLPWTDEGPGFLARLECLFGERIAILTSPCLTEGGVEGKVAWIAKHLPAYRKRFFIGPSKYLFAAPGKILVDDNDGNVDKFREAGGTAVLVPRTWNARKTETDGQGRFDVGKITQEIIAAIGGG